MAINIANNMQKNDHFCYLFFLEENLVSTKTIKISKSQNMSYLLFYVYFSPKP